MSDSPTVFMYHSISSDDVHVKSRWAVTQSTFRQQLQFLSSNGFVTPPLSDIVSGAYRQRHGGKRTLVLTFDDGYLDNFVNAFPVLMEFGYSAVMFLVADFSRRHSWWGGREGMSGAPLVEKHHIREMAAAGVEFGSHSFSHRELTHLSDEDLPKETRGSRLALEELLGHQLMAFAYPYGRHDRRVRSAVQGAGYVCAFATSAGPGGFFDDLYQIRRVTMENHHGWLFMRTKCAQNAQKVMGRLAHVKQTRRMW